MHDSIIQWVSEMNEKTIVITGASDGIGKAAAASLKSSGANVIITGRSREKTKAVADELKVPYYVADYSNLDDVRKLGTQLKNDYSTIHILANNAGGIMGSERILTADGYDRAIQVNHLGGFLLTNLLMDTLCASKAIVINTSSSAQQFSGETDVADLKLDKGYSRMGAYGKSKLMNVLFTKELHRRYNSQGISTAAFHPGVVRTNFGHEFGGSTNVLYSGPIKYVLRTPEKGADTLVWLATTTPGKEWTSGEYYSNRRIKRPSKQAEDPQNAVSLWDNSMKATGLA